MATERDGTRDRDRTRERRNKECSSLKIVLLLGDDEAIEAAAAWALRRARALGGQFQLWHTSDANPFRYSIRVMNAEGGQQREWNKYVRNPNQGDRGYHELLEGYPEGCTRIDELVVIHHSHTVREKKVILGLMDILVLEKKVPVCKLVYWSCYTDMQLDVSVGEAIDVLMKGLGGLSRMQDDCPCPDLVELIWPTPGRSYLDPTAGEDRLETNDGNVNRLRWGYRHPDGQLHRTPDPNDPTPSRNPTSRESSQGRGTVLGAPVGQH